MPEVVADETELEELLSRPSPALVDMKPMQPTRVELVYLPYYFFDIEATGMRWRNLRFRGAATAAHDTLGATA